MALGKYMQFQCCLILYAFCHLLHPTLVHTNILAEAIGLLVAYVLEVISCVNFFSNFKFECIKPENVTKYK